MKLAIIRHGEAGRAATDKKRPLTTHGQQQAKELAAWLATQPLQQPLLWASPYLRAQQTAEYIAKACQLPIHTQNFIFPDANPKQVIEELISVNQDLIFVAHQPLVGYLASLLLQGRAEPMMWSPAECLVLEGDVFAANCLELSAHFK